MDNNHRRWLIRYFRSNRKDAEMRKQKQLSDEEIQEILAAETERQVRLNDARKAIDADNNFVSRVKEEKEYRQDNKDKDEQEARGNRVTHASMVWGDLFPLFVFLIIAAGLWAFVETYIVPISGW